MHTFEVRPVLSLVERRERRAAHVRIGRVPRGSSGGVVCGARASGDGRGDSVAIYYDRVHDVHLVNTVILTKVQVGGSGRGCGNYLTTVLGGGITVIGTISRNCRLLSRSRGACFLCSCLSHDRRCAI